MILSNSNNNLKLDAGLLRRWSAFTFQEETIMSDNQIQRLRKDSAELETYANVLKREGEFELMKKIKTKKEFLDNHIESVMEVAA